MQSKGVTISIMVLVHVSD